MHVKAKLEVPIENYVIEPSESEIPILLPRCFYKDQNQPDVCLVNASDRYYTIKKNSVIAQAEIVNEIESNIRASQIIQGDNSEELPEKLEKMLKKSSSHLSPTEKQQLRTLLLDYQDIFSKDDFDIGTFKEVEHRIDTGDSAPIKERIRRTPLQFVEEEKEQLAKMLQAGVIEPSVAEWAAAPVLIRKSDGKVRYAIDYRKST